MEDEVIALVPWIDFMNHDPDSKAYVAATRDGNGPAVLLKTDRPYQGDEQIFDSYGRRSNDELLLLYGFSLTRNVTQLQKNKKDGQINKRWQADPLGV